MTDTQRLIDAIGVKPYFRLLSVVDAADRELVERQNTMQPGWAWANRKATAHTNKPDT